MLKKKTVVLVTHQVSMSAHYADKIVVLGSDGTIKEQGTYDVRGHTLRHFPWAVGVSPYLVFAFE